VREAGACGAAAVIFKAERSLPATLVAIAQEARVALAFVHPEVSWGDLYGLLMAALAESAEGASATGQATDLFGLANGIATIAGGAVIIQDAREALLAYSNLAQPIDEARRQVILRRGLSEDSARRQREEGIGRQIRAAAGVIRWAGLESHGRKPRMVIAVRAGQEYLGSISVVEDGPPLGARAETALKSAAPAVALYLTRERASRDSERRRRRELLRDLLEREARSDWIAAELGVAERTTCAIVAFECDSGPAGDAAEWSGALELIAQSCGLLVPSGLCLPIGHTVYALVLGRDAEPVRLRRFATDIVEKARASLSTEVHAGLGSIVSRLADVARSRSEADRILRVLNGRRDPVVADIDAVRHLVVLAELKEIAQERTNLTAGKLDWIREHDARFATSYEATLRAYLDNFGDVPACALELNIHPNTLRYRIRRAAEMSGLDLSDPDQRLVVSLQLRLVPSGREPEPRSRAGKSPDIRTRSGS
jgi:hypothetical protein